MIANNKFLTKKVLRAAGIATPQSYLVKTPKEALKKVLEKNLFPCVLKPSTGAHGHKVYANIETLEEFKSILHHVFKKSEERDVLIEQYIEGNDYRVLVVGDSVSAVMERVPAHVIGNGESTIRNLITVFNKHPLVGKKYEKPMCKIRLNGEVKRVLGKQRKKLTYVPKEGEIVQLRQNANISTGGIGKDATDSVRADVKELAVQAVEALGMEISGVDVIQDKLSKKPYILELNDCPGIDIHHYPAVGQPRDVAGDIIEYLIRDYIKISEVPLEHLSL